jgi:signal transduction histidine kinase
VRARERSTGCGTTAACAQCGAVQAILESISTHGRSVNECRVRTSSKDGEGAFDFRVYATWAEIGNEDMVVLALQDISSEKRRQVLEHTLLDASSEAERAPAQAADANPEAEERFHREFGDMSSRILDQIEWHRQLLAAEGGTLQVNDEEVNVHGLLERRVAESRSNWAGRGREVSVRDRGFDWVRTDPGLLGRALDGLLRNALEATPEGGSVEVRAMHDGYALEIAVRNAGVIPDAVQHQIFQRSFSTKHGDGHGIGTYSVKLLVERYLGGSVEFTSDAEHGTTFTVVVPDRSPRRAAA